MPGDREGLKRELATIFNKVSASKVVQVNEVVTNFDNLAGSNFGMFERGPVTNKVHSLVSKVPAAPGVFVDNTSTYVTPEFLKQGMLQAVDRGDVDGHEDVARRMALTAVEAVERSTDQTAKVKTGQIKPKAP